MFRDVIEGPLDSIADLDKTSDFDNFFDSFIKNSQLRNCYFVGKYRIKSISESCRKNLLFGSKLSDVISLFDNVRIFTDDDNTYIIFALKADLKEVDKFYKNAKEKFLI